MRAGEHEPRGRGGWLILLFVYLLFATAWSALITADWWSFAKFYEGPGAGENLVAWAMVLEVVITLAGGAAVVLFVARSPLFPLIALWFFAGRFALTHLEWLGFVALFGWRLPVLAMVPHLGAAWYLLRSRRVHFAFIEQEQRSP